jgi:hypothetical protein
MLSRMRSFLHNAPGSVTQRFHCMDASQSPNGPHLGTLLNPIPNISDAPALLVYPSRTGLFFYTLTTADGDRWMVLRPKGHAARIGLQIGSLATLSRPVTLTFQCFAYFGHATLVHRAITARALYCTVVLGGFPIPSWPRTT